MAPCRNHPERETAQTCAGCGDPFCDGCLVRFEKLLLCEQCKARFLTGVDEGPRPPRAAATRVARERQRARGEGGRPLDWVFGCTALVFAGLFGIVIITTIAEPWAAFRADRQTNTAIERLVQIGAAMERYRADHGGYPGTLEELLPTYLTEIPEDPYSGKPPRYVSAEPRRLWSVGPDGKDDDGVAPDDLVYPIDPS